MVHHRMRSHRGGTRGGSARPPVAQSPEPASPSPPHENPPPHSSVHSRHPNTRNGRVRAQASGAGHSDFRLHTTTFPLPPLPVPHSTQFKFRSNLNRPIITANITIVFSEGIKLQDAPLRRSEVQHQEESRQGNGRDSRKLPMEEGRGIRSGGLHAEGGHSKDTRPPGGSLVEVSSLLAVAGSTSGIHPAWGPQGGVSKEEEDWYQYACLVEKIPTSDELK